MMQEPAMCRLHHVHVHGIRMQGCRNHGILAGLTGLECLCWS